MNNPDTKRSNHELECLDPVLGDQLWQLSTSDCPSGLRTRLEHHLTYCAACRLQQAVERGIETGLRNGDLVLPAPVPRFARVANWTVACGTTALAAGLVLLFVLPPAAPHDGMVLRGDDGPAIERPVPDEVVRGGRPTLRWTPLAGATRYEVRVTAADSDHTWTTSTREPVATVPPGEDLPLDMRFRARIEPVPAHLAPAGGIRTSFCTGSTRKWLSYRLRHGHTPGRWLGGVGLAGLLAGMIGLLARRLPR